MGMARVYRHVLLGPCTQDRDRSDNPLTAPAKFYVFWKLDHTQPPAEHSESEGGGSLRSPRCIAHHTLEYYSATKRSKALTYYNMEEPGGHHTQGIPWIGNVSEQVDLLGLEMFWDWLHNLRYQ